eukprot:3300136-Rhodomonas_salina.1
MLRLGTGVKLVLLGSSRRSRLLRAGLKSAYSCTASSLLIALPVRSLPYAPAAPSVGAAAHIPSPSPSVLRTRLATRMNERQRVRVHRWPRSNYFESSVCACVKKGPRSGSGQPWGGLGGAQAVPGIGGREMAAKNGGGAQTHIGGVANVELAELIVGVGHGHKLGADALCQESRPPPEIKYKKPRISGTQCRFAGFIFAVLLNLQACGQLCSSAIVSSRSTGDGSHHEIKRAQRHLWTATAFVECNRWRDEGMQGRGKRIPQQAASQCQAGRRALSS